MKKAFTEKLVAFMGQSAALLVSVTIVLALACLVGGLLTLLINIMGGLFA